jgi:hypothetical protein
MGEGIGALLPSTAQANCGAAFRRGHLGGSAAPPRRRVHAPSCRPVNTTSARKPDTHGVRCAVALRSDHFLETITLSEPMKSVGVTVLPSTMGRNALAKTAAAWFGHYYYIPSTPPCHCSSRRRYDFPQTTPG